MRPASRTLDHAYRSARCLGKVQDWNAEDGVLEAQAMAIFR